MRARRDVSSQSLRHVSVSGGVARAVVEGGQEQIDEPQPPLVRHDIVSQVDHRVCPMPFYVLLFAFGWRHLAVAVFDPLPQFLTIFPPFKRELNAPQVYPLKPVGSLVRRAASAGVIAAKSRLHPTTRTRWRVMASRARC